MRVRPFDSSSRGKEGRPRSCCSPARGSGRPPDRRPARSGFTAQPPKSPPPTRRARSRAHRASVVACGSPGSPEWANRGSRVVAPYGRRCCEVGDHRLSRTDDARRRVGVVADPARDLADDELELADRRGDVPGGQRRVDLRQRVAERRRQRRGVMRSSSSSAVEQGTDVARRRGERQLVELDSARARHVEPVGALGHAHQRRRDLLPGAARVRDVDRQERLGVGGTPAQGQRAGADGASLDTGDPDEVHRVEREPVAGVERRDLAQAVRRRVVDDRACSPLVASACSACSSRGLSSVTVVAEEGRSRRAAAVGVRGTDLRRRCSRSRRARPRPASRSSAVHPVPGEQRVGVGVVVAQAVAPVQHAAQSIVASSASVTFTSKATCVAPVGERAVLGGDDLHDRRGVADRDHDRGEADPSARVGHAHAGRVLAVLGVGVADLRWPVGEGAGALEVPREAEREAVGVGAAGGREVDRRADRGPTSPMRSSCGARALGALGVVDPVEAGVGVRRGRSRRRSRARRANRRDRTRSRSRCPRPACRRR